MRWALTQSANELHYWKMDQGDYVAELKYNKQAKSFRLTSGDKRLFFIERGGFLQSRYLIRTEYSLSAGEVHPGKSLRSGVALIDDKKYHYCLTGKSLELSSKTEKLLVTIEMDDINNIRATELCALLFSTLRVVTRQVAPTAEKELA